MLNYPSVCYVPDLLPDELLYSLLGRIGALNALGTPKARMELFFGACNLIPSIDLPSALEILQRRLGSNSPYSSSGDLINNGTIYPYHRPFLTAERHETVERLMLYGDGKKLKTVMGRVANRFGAAPILRYCSACNEADVAKFGVPYWHRTHQLPGVTSCSLHGLNLINYYALSPTDKQRMVLAPTSASFGPLGGKSDPQQKDFAILSSDLLTAQLPALEAEHRRKIYLDELIRHGFGRKSRIDHVALVIAVREYYRDFEGFAHRERLLSTKVSPVCWLRVLVDRPLRSSHPICHLLLIGFLFKTVSKFIEAVDYEKWQQPSTVTGKLNADRQPIAFAPETGRPALLDARFSCREVARVLHLSVTTIVKQRQALGVVVSERPKYLSAVRLAPIFRDLKDGVSPQNIANTYYVSLSTVYRLRARFSEETHASVIRKRAAELKCRRSHWMQLLEASQFKCLHDARVAAPSTYTWLYRHDREWLKEKSSHFHSRRSPRLRVDWPERDLAFCKVVSDIVRKVISEPGRPRISRTLMARHLDDALIRANISKLPRLHALLKQLEETPLAYQLYRIDCAVVRLVENNQPLIDWRIRRSAGIRRWTKTHSDYAALKAMKFEPGFAK